jgi:hypothetical protein
MPPSDLARTNPHDGESALEGKIQDQGPDVEKDFSFRYVSTGSWFPEKGLGRMRRKEGDSDAPYSGFLWSRKSYKGPWENQIERRLPQGTGSAWRTASPKGRHRFSCSFTSDGGFACSNSISPYSFSPHTPTGKAQAIIRRGWG